MSDNTRLGIIVSAVRNDATASVVFPQKQTLCKLHILSKTETSIAIGIMVNLSCEQHIRGTSVKPPYRLFDRIRHCRFPHRLDELNTACMPVRKHDIRATPVAQVCDA